MENWAIERVVGLVFKEEELSLKTAQENYYDYLATDRPSRLIEAIRLADEVTHLNAVAAHLCGLLEKE